MSETKNQVSRPNKKFEANFKQENKDKDIQGGCMVRERWTTSQTESLSVVTLSFHIIYVKTKNMFYLDTIRRIKSGRSPKRIMQG